VGSAELLDPYEGYKITMANTHHWRLTKDGVSVRSRFVSRESTMMYIVNLKAISVDTYTKLLNLHRTVAGWGYIDADGWRIEPYETTGIGHG
jgi:hypothetical protein